MKRILLLLLGVVGLYFGGRAIVHGLASDETKIRWIVEELEASFDAARVGGCIEAVAPDWRHEGNAWLDRRSLSQGLAHTFFTERGGDKRFLLRVEIPADNLVIDVRDDEADVRAVVKFFRSRGPTWELAWHFELEAHFRDGEDGWEIDRTSHRDISGHRF